MYVELHMLSIFTYITPGNHVNQTHKLLTQLIRQAFDNCDESTQMYNFLDKHITIQYFIYVRIYFWFTIKFIVIHTWPINPKYAIQKYFIQIVWFISAKFQLINMEIKSLSKACCLVRFSAFRALYSYLASNTKPCSAK